MGGIVRQHNKRMVLIQDKKNESVTITFHNIIKSDVKKTCINEVLRGDLVQTTIKLSGEELDVLCELWFQYKSKK